MIEPTRMRIPIKMASSPPPSSHSPLALEHIASSDDDDDDGAHFLITFYSSSPTKKREKRKMMPRVMQTSSLVDLQKKRGNRVSSSLFFGVYEAFERFRERDMCEE